MRHLSFGEKTRVLEWLKNNSERAQKLKSSKAADACSREIGLDVSGSQLINIARNCNLDLFVKGTAPPDIEGKTGSWYDVAASLARAIQLLNRNLGFESPEAENLRLIIERLHKKVTDKRDLF